MSITGNLSTMLRVKRNVFLQSHFEYFCLTPFLRPVLTSHSASISRVSEVSNFVLMSFMMSEERWTAVENVVFFSKRRIIIKLPVRKLMQVSVPVMALGTYLPVCFQTVKIAKN